MAFENGQLGNLIVEISADIDKLKKGLTDADKEVSKFSLKSQVSVKGLTSAFLTLGGAIGIGVVGAMTAAVKSTLAYNDEIFTASKRTGIATETLSKLKFVAEQTESSFAALTQGFKFLSRNIFEASTGNDKLLASFQSLGVEVKDQNGKLITTEAAFLRIADKIASLTNQTEKAGLAMQVFGRNGVSLLPVLELGSEGIEKLSKRAEQLGLVLTTENAEAIDNLDDSIKELQAAVGGASLSIGTSLIPMLTRLVEFIKTGVTPILENLNATLVNTADVVSSKQLNEAFKSSDPVLQNAQIDFVKLQERKKELEESIAVSQTAFGGAGTPQTAIDQAELAAIEAKIERTKELIEVKREQVQEQLLTAAADPAQDPEIIAEQLKKDNLFQIQNEIALMSDQALQQEVINAERKVLLTKTTEEQRSAIIRKELEARAKAQQLDNQNLAQSFTLLSTLITTFAGQSKAAAIVLKAIRIGEILINGMRALSEIDAVWAWNPPVAATLKTGQKISTALQIATVAAQGFATGTDSVPARLTPGEMVVPNTFSDAIREGKLSLSGPDGGGQSGNIHIENISITVNGDMDESQVPNIIEELGIQLENRLRGAI